MAHFAKLDSNNIVEEVIVVGENDLIDPKAWWDPLGFFNNKDSEKVGIAFCQNHWKVTFREENTVWKQTWNGEDFSYENPTENMSEEMRSKYCRHVSRGNYAGIGMSYMEGVKTLGVGSTDIFIESRPFDMNGKLCESWSIGINTACYLPPGPPGWPSDLTSFEFESDLRYLWDEDKYRENPNYGWVLKKVTVSLGRE